MRAPHFWDNTKLLSTALLPFSAVYALCSRLCAASVTPEQVSTPVICVGNLVAGGAGKTPVALALGTLLKEKNIKAHYLSRGYKGRLNGLVQVDINTHTAEDVGDEPLLLARVLPCWVAKDRVAGAKAAIAAGAELILMDDGFQNPSIHKDISLLVCDGAHGFGNGRLLPAGPLREPIAQGMQRASAVVLMGDDHHNVLAHVPAGKPVLRAHVREAAGAESVRGKTVVAFSGIASPHKFYHTLQRMECSVVNTMAFPDHYNFTGDDIALLRKKAESAQALLVTTEKDFVRLPPQWREGIVPVPVETVFEDVAALLKIVLPDAA